ncbi:MAG: SpoIID/LytB domain-containing protein [Myxococcota bacterium]
MKAARFFALLVSAGVAAPAHAAETMRIAMGAEVSEIVLSGDGLSVGDDADDARFEPLGQRATVTLVDGHLAVDGKPLPRESLRFRAETPGTLTAMGTRVRGDVVVLPGRTRLVAVNVLALEEYLVGVLGSEMPKSFPLEALKAQAVAARTYALNKKLEQYGQPYHLGSSVISQVYKGLDVEDARTREAVEATRGLVLTYDLQPIEAYFHASCGGRTESGADALGRDLPYLKPVDCPCGRLPTSHWTLTLKSSELSSLFKKASGLQVQGRTRTGRVQRVTVGPRSVDAVTFRERVGYMKLKSLDFEVEKAKDGYRLDGHGFGHGAGMCQWGARVYAEKGWGFEKILQHYYPGTELQVLYE